jgi:outer membrane protein insertion porin family
MNAYLNSQGYYYALFSDSVRIDTVKDQLRTSIHMFIDIGKNITIDSVSYNLGDTTLQKLTDSVAPKTFLKKGSPYTKESISSELDRLVGTYRENGYYKFTREDIYASVDSMDTRLLQLTLDPFKQAQIIADAARLRKENPTWDIDVLKRPTFDSSKLYQYHIGRVYYYPETKLTDIVDSLPDQKGFLELNRRNLTMRYKKGLFNYRVLREHTYLRNGDLYKESDYFKTINTLGQIGAWQQVDGKAIVRDKDTLDMHFFLVPAIKQNYGIDLEGSRNTADVGSWKPMGIHHQFFLQ